MYDINTKNVKKGRNIFFIFLAIGILFLIIFLALVISNKNKMNSLDSVTTSTSVVVNTSISDDGNTLYSPTYFYKVDGVEYSCPSTSSSSINPGTENKKVYFDSKNPSNCMTEYSKSSNKIIIIIFMIIPIIFIVVAIINIIKVNKRVKLINELNQKGKLVKNLPYHLENTGTVVNGVAIQRPVVDYTLPSGSVLTLQGDPRNDGIVADSDGMVDLIIDESNPNNYFIDFEINRLSGNLPTDYYNNNQSQNTVPPQQIPNTNVASDINNTNQVSYPNNYPNVQNQNIPQVQMPNTNVASDINNTNQVSYPNNYPNIQNQNIPQVQMPQNTNQINQQNNINNHQ